MTFDSSLRDSANRLQETSLHEAIPSDLRTRILAEIPGSPELQDVSKRQGMRQLSGVCALVAVVSVGFISRQFYFRAHASHLLAAPSSAAPVPVDTTAKLRRKVLESVNKANTWHLSGHETVRLIDNDAAGGLGKPTETKWEMWGRRKPFFFREERGNEIVVDDGTKRYHYVPEQAVADDKAAGIPAHRRPSILIIRPSSQYFPYSAGELGNLLVGDNTVFPSDLAVTLASAGHIVKSPPLSITDIPGMFDRDSVEGVTTIEHIIASKEVNFRSTLSIDKHTQRPTAYSYLSSPNRNGGPPAGGAGDGTRYVREETTPEYNCVIPARLLSQPKQPHALVFEVLETGKKAVNGSPELQIRGLDAVASPLDLGTDTAATGKTNELAYRVDWRLNGAPIHDSVLAEMLPLTFQLEKLSDATGGTYLELPNGATTGGRNFQSVWFPVEPRQLENVASRQVVGKYQVGVEGYDIGGATGFISPAYIAPITVTLALPERSSITASRPLALATSAVVRQIIADRSAFYTYSEGPHAIPAIQAPAGTRINEPARLFSVPLAPPRARQFSPEQYARAVYWTNAAITESEKAHEKGAATYYRTRLANLGSPPQ